MSKNYGPKGFENAWKKALKGFNETKIFFKKDGAKTLIQYIDGDKLLGVSMYRCQFEMDVWLNHFQHYLDNDVFDTNAYWVTYTSKRENPDDAMSKLTSVYGTEIIKVPMILKNKVWSIHSPEMNAVMKKMRKKQGDLGFKHIPRLLNKIRKYPEII